MRYKGNVNIQNTYMVFKLSKDDENCISLFTTTLNKSKIP